MLGKGRYYLERSPWMMAFSGLVIMVTVLGVNLLGDGLRDVVFQRTKI